MQTTSPGGYVESPEQAIDRIPEILRQYLSPKHVRPLDNTEGIGGVRKVRNMLVNLRLLKPLYGARRGTVLVVDTGRMREFAQMLLTIADEADKQQSK